MVDKTKVIAMYLPQYHEEEFNNKAWGQGFTDWVTVKTAEPLFPEHRQPRIPADGKYYDLSIADNIASQAKLALENGIDGWGIYHYWFSSDLQVLTKPAELLLEHKEIPMPFFFAWDNCSWVRSWSRLQHNTNAWSPKYDKEQGKGTTGILAELKYGDEAEWEKHFRYLLPFFKDERYIKKNGSPVFIIWNYYQKDTLRKMCDYWRKLAKEEGFPDMYLISRYNRYDSMDGLDALFNYEPMFTAWQNKNLLTRVLYKVRDKLPVKKGLTIYSYEKIWKRILRFAKAHPEETMYYGGFVSYDDTPRRGVSGKLMRDENPEAFEKYFRELFALSKDRKKDYVFLTAWNEWGEGAYLEPDTIQGMSYLEAVEKAVSDIGQSKEKGT